MFNTIVLLHGKGEIKEKGDTVFGIDCNPEEVQRWSIEQDAEAKAELAKHRCDYNSVRTFYNSTVIDADEWALEYCECDEDGEFIQGSDYWLAETSEDSIEF